MWRNGWGSFMSRDWALDRMFVCLVIVKKVEMKFFLLSERHRRERYL